MTPFGLAFEYLENPEDQSIFVMSDGWSATESIVDIVFIIEIFICFNTSYYNPDHDESKKVEQYVTSRRQIAINYLKGWFWIDALAVLPRFLKDFEKDAEDSGSGSGLIQALAFMKIARIGRLVKLLRLFKLFKALEAKDKLKKVVHNKTKMSVAKERLLIFSVFAIIFVHTISCLWIMLGVKDDPLNMNWIDGFGFDHDQMWNMYFIGVYWTITTITTVGYGDISATNTAERIVACFIMVIGVIAFSFSTGALSSLISDEDSRLVVYRQKLDVIKALRK